MHFNPLINKSDVSDRTQLKVVKLKEFIGLFNRDWANSEHARTQRLSVLSWPRFPLSASLVLS